MTDVRFVVDPVAFDLDALSHEDLGAELDEFLLRVETAQSRDEPVAYSHDVFSRPVRGSLTLWEVLSTGGDELMHELSQRMAAALSRASRWEDDGSIPSEWSVTIAGHTEENVDVAWAHARCGEGHAVALLGVSRSGVHPVVQGKSACEMHWVQTEAAHRTFFRKAIDLEGDCRDTVVRLAAHAFPDLCFLEGALDGIDDFEGGYEAAKPHLRSTFAILDDRGYSAFTELPATNQEIPRRLLPLDLAPEKPDVGKDRKCRSARERRLGGELLYCHWHVKLEGHRNRVHLHPPTAASDGKLIVAILHRHLPLPGD